MNQVEHPAGWLQLRGEVEHEGLVHRSCVSPRLLEVQLGLLSPCRRVDVLEETQDDAVVECMEEWQDPHTVPVQVAQLIVDHADASGAPQVVRKCVEFLVPVRI